MSRESNDHKITGYGFMNLFDNNIYYLRDEGTVFSSFL